MATKHQKIDGYKKKIDKLIRQLSETDRLDFERLYEITVGLKGLISDKENQNKVVTKYWMEQSPEICDKLEWIVLGRGLDGESPTMLEKFSSKLTKAKRKELEAVRKKVDKLLD